MSSGESYIFTDKWLEFDLRRIADPRESGGMVMKIDCHYPCGSGDVPLEDDVAIGEWKSYRYALSDLVHRPGSTLDLRKINTPLVILAS